MKKRLNYLLALAAVGAGLVLSTPGTAHAASYTIVGTYGANIRIAPTVNSTVVRVAARGASVNVVCQTAGDRFGSGPNPDNRTWDKLSDGRYVHDHLVSTPGGVRQNLSGGGYAYWTPSLPRCAADTPSTPHTSTGPSTYARGGRGAAGGWPIPATSATVPGCPSIMVDPTRVQPASGIPLNYSGPLFVETYPVNGCFLAARSAAGYANVGRASNAAHRWGAGYTQDFDRGAWGWNAIMFGDGVGRAFVVRSGMWDAYRSRDGVNKLGYPIGNEYRVAGGAVQLFERGMIVWYSGRGAVVVTNRSANNGGSSMTKFSCDYEWTNRGYAGRNCTDYVAWRMASDGHPIPGAGDAKDWSASLAAQLGWVTDSTPRPGDIAWSNSGRWGHVAYVRAVNADGSLEIEEWNRVRCQYSITSRVSVSNFTGFIHPTW